MRLAVVRSFPFFLAAIVCALLIGPAFSQTPDQLDAFRNLTPEQQRALIDQAGRGASDGSAQTQRPREGVRPGEAAADPQSDLERRRRRAATGDEQLDPLLLNRDDTVLVQISLPERRLRAPAPADPAQGQSMQPQAGQAPMVAPLPDAQGRGVNAVGANQGDASRLYLEPLEYDDEERTKLQGLIDLIRSRNPYKLDRNANLNLPGFAPIAVGGLNEAQATQRLAAEPALLKLEVKLVRLPLMKTGLEGLKRFGYDLFESAPSTFAPVTDVPVPADYVVGPGDEFKVQLFGNTNRTLTLPVSRDGTVSFPELGPIRVGGLSFTAAREAIERRVGQQMIGVQANVSIGDTRAIRVFVLGEAMAPGSYTVSGLATVTSALFASGGVKPIGSLRDIQLKRRGQVVQRLDLYDLLIHGNTSDDAKLLPGDVIFIPPVGAVVTVDGEVKRPAIYELRGETDMADVIRMAGGLTPDSDSTRVNVTRIDDGSRRVVVPVNLTSGSAGQNARNGDIVRVARLRPQIDAGVVLDGFVHRPGPFAWREGLRLTDVIGSIDELKPNADPHYILIRREFGLDRRVSVRSADLVAALAAPGSAADVALSPRDQITVFDLGPGRDRIIQPVIDELKLQSELSRPTEVVRIEGRIKVPGQYPLEPAMTVRDLLRAGGNLDSAAYGGKAELARYTVSETGVRQTELIEIDLAAVRRGDASADLALRPFDYLLVKETSDWNSEEYVTLKGEVRFPGTYPIRRGETLAELLARAGGLSQLAFPRGAAFTRKELREREQKQLDQLADRMQSDIGSMSLQAAAVNQGNAGQALLAGQSLLTQLRTSKAVGRLVIDLPGLLAQAPRGTKDVTLRGGDELVVPKMREEVTVIGEVSSVTSHLYSRSLSRDDYISLSGGTTRKADRSRIYVVRADGSVATEARSLFARNYDLAIQPGDTIVVPLNAERMPRLPFWQAVTQIIYNLAVSVAAVNSF